MTGGVPPGIVVPVKAINRKNAEPIHDVSSRPGGRHLYVVPERRVPREAFAPAGRSLHLIDIENLMGGPDGGGLALRRTVADYQEAELVVDGDHVIMGANPRLGIAAKASWPNARLVVRGGPDGADIALLETVSDVRFIAARYDRIVVGSGDGVFEVVVREYRSCGLAVGVISRQRSLSYALGASASFVRLLPDVDLVEETV